MSNSTKVTTAPCFFELYATGHALADEIDDFVSVWHGAADSWARELPLHEFLGLSEAEYELWVHDPDCLPLILTARRDQRPLETVIGEHVKEFWLATRTADADEIKQLQRWLAARKKI